MHLVIAASAQLHHVNRHNFERIAVGCVLDQNKLLPSSLHVVKLAGEYRGEASFNLFAHLQGVFAVCFLHIESQDQSRHSFAHSGVTTSADHSDGVVRHNNSTFDVETIDIMGSRLVVNCNLAFLGIFASLNLQGPIHL